MSGFGGETAAMAQQNPVQGQQIDHYRGLTEEQLQEAALRTHSPIAQRVLEQKRASYTPPAAAAPVAGDPSTPPVQYAFGGSLQPKGGVHISQRASGFGSSPPTPGGFLHTAGPGRTDNLKIKPHADSYVLPADVVSGVGQGNSLAGAKALEAAFHTGPFGVPLGKSVGHRMGPPRRAAGGPAQTVPIIAAGGEYVLTPEQCQALGHQHCKPGSKRCTPAADIRRGHEILDAFVLHARKKNIKDLRGLKGPVKA